MFLHIFIFAVCIPAFLAADNTISGRAVEECNNQYNITDSLNVMEITRFVSCKMACVMKKVGNMGENGSFLVEKMVERISRKHPEYLEEISKFRMCTELPLERDECTTAGNLWDCLLKKMRCGDFMECIARLYAYLLIVD